ncbi:MAG: DUF3800 domain-containing protein [Bacillota bacterium]|nr:DUF3800 domain-containing protein [Bacillota bacterium]
MKIYIDESGAFTWGNQPSISLFCGVTVADRDSDALFARFVNWKRTIVGDSKREIKGAELTDAQLEGFAKSILGIQGHDFWLTVVGLDTTRTKREHVEELRRQAWVMAERSSELAAEHNNPQLKEFYRQQAGWLKRRSAENMLWIVGLEHTLVYSLQHSIMRFMEPEDDGEYLSMNVLIDRSFIQREQHINFWREWLRNGLCKSSRPPMIIPNTWKARNHPFIQAYEIRPGLLNFNKLILNDTDFFRSHEHAGLQLADICAHALGRYHRGLRAVAAYLRLRTRIVGRNGAEIYQVIVDERSLHTDDPRNHVDVFDEAEFVERADKLRNWEA